MKSLAFLLVVFVLGVKALAGEPPVSIRTALQIAEKSLADRGLEKKVWIESITLDRASLLGSADAWFVKWNQSIPASDPKKRELGVSVSMDGKAVRLVK